MVEKQKVRLIFAIIIFMIIFSAVYFLVYILPDISGALRETEVLSYSTMQSSDIVSCYLVRSETVSYASYSGDIIYYAEETEKTRKNTKILDISSNGVLHSYSSKDTGFISYYYDGYEELFFPENIENLNIEELDAIEFDVRALYGLPAEAGKAIFKNVFSDTWYLVFRVSEEKSEKYIIGNKLKVDISGTVISFEVDSIRLKDGYAVISIKSTRFYENFAKLRKLTAKVITSEYSGLLVSDSAIFESEGQKYVYERKIDGSYESVAVNVLISDGKHSILDSDDFTVENADGSSKKVPTVNLYDEVLRKAPSSANENEAEKE